MGYELIVMICLAKPGIPTATNSTMQQPYVECAESGVKGGFKDLLECNSVLSGMGKGGNFTFAYCQRR